MLIPKQSPLSPRNIVPHTVPDLRRPADFRDMLAQFLPGWRWIASQAERAIGRSSLLLPQRNPIAEFLSIVSAETSMISKSGTVRP
ncbi:MAG: hypothetical protein ACRD1F_12365, partial [Terriglobales bacterium]